MSKHHSTIIIGAGLSGLYIAWKLQQQKKDVILLEARARTGGRILSPQINEDIDHRIDLGPAWIWPQFQPRLSQLLNELKIDLFEQYTRGHMLYEQNSQNIQQHAGPSSHNQSYRVSGGAEKLTRTLTNRLNDACIFPDTPVTAINQSTLNIQATRDKQNLSFSADNIILALPPRVTLQTISFTPPLSNDIVQLWKNTPTWMAGHCKLVFIYNTAFWREQNLSGEVFSHHGPLSEIYDGSPDHKNQHAHYYALTAFVGLNAVQRKSITSEDLIQQSMQQLQRLFGDESQNVIDIKIKDWSEDSNTCVDIDLHGTPQHPQYPKDMPRFINNKKIILAGTELARENGGYLEGALESADEAIAILTD